MHSKQTISRKTKEQGKRRALNTREAARYIGMSESWLKKSRLDGERKGRTPGPPYVKKGRIVRYLIEDLDKWLEEDRYEVQQLPDGVV